MQKNCWRNNLRKLILHEKYKLSVEKLKQNYILEMIILSIKTFKTNLELLLII